VRPTTVLFSEMTPPSGWEGEFNSWYDEEHIPLRMAVPGFMGAQRYRAPTGGAYLVVYELTSPRVLQTDAYLAVKRNPSLLTQRMLTGVTGFTRYVAEGISARRANHCQIDPLDALALYVVWFSVPTDRADEFNAWYDRDHVPALFDCPDWLATRRFRVFDGEPKGKTHLALHYLADLRALDSPARARARESPWRRRLAAEPWFQGQYAAFERHGHRHSGVGAN
jgi:hypothetical protein